MGAIASSAIEQAEKFDIPIPDYRNHLPQPDSKKSSNVIDKNGIEAIKSFNMNGSNLRKIPSHSSLLQFYPHSRFRPVVHSSGRHHPDAITSIDNVPASTTQQFGNSNNFDVKNDKNLKSIKSNEKVATNSSASDLGPSELLAGNSNFSNNYLSENSFVSNNNDYLISLNDKTVNLSFIKSLLTNKVIYKLLEFILSIIDVIRLSPFRVTYKKIQPQSLGLNDEVKPTESSFVQRVEINPEIEVVDKTQNKLKQNSWKHDKACNKSVKLHNFEKVETKFNVKNSSTVNAHKTLLLDYLNMNSLSKIRQVNSQRSRLDSCKGSSRQVCSSTTSLLQSSQLEHKERDNIDNQYLHKKFFINKNVGTKSHKCKSKANKVDLKKSLPVEFQPTRLVDNHKRVFGNFHSNKKNINYNKEGEFKFLKNNSI